MAPAQTYFYYASTPHIDIIQLHSSLWQDSRIFGWCWFLQIWLIKYFCRLPSRRLVSSCVTDILTRAGGVNNTGLTGLVCVCVRTYVCSLHLMIAFYGL